MKKVHGVGLAALVAVQQVVGCSSGSSTSAPATTVDAGTPVVDAGAPGVDASVPVDAAPAVDAAPPPPPPESLPFSYCTGKPNAELTFSPGQEQDVLDAVNTLDECTTVKFNAGTFHFNNALTIRQKGVTLKGAGKGLKGGLVGDAASTVLEFATAASNTNGIDHKGDWFIIRDLAVVDAKKDAVRIEAATNVRILSVRTEWTAENNPRNGAYGLYPVKSTNILMQDCEAYNAADAGIYVGQSKNVIVRRNIAKQNVAGLEIENTQNADVYDNLTEDNTTGLVAFDLPGNPIRGTDVKLHDNVVKNNNRANFGAGIVGIVPAGTGTFVLASRRVEITHNRFSNNVTVDVGVLSGLDVESDKTKWLAGGNNWQISDVWIHDNTCEGGSGGNVDNGQVDLVKREIGFLLFTLYDYGHTQGVPSIEHVVWDGVDATATDNMLNDVNLCVTGNTMPASEPFMVTDLNFVASSRLASQFRVDEAWAKTGHYAQSNPLFSCSGFTPAISAITLPE